MSAQGQLPDLPPELLTVVSDCLHDVADFIRFHAVCQAWRDSLHATMSTELRGTCFPWLIDAPSGNRSSIIRLRCVFSRRGYYTEAPACLNMRSWVAGADGAAPYVCLGKTLVHPLTGDTTTVTVPPFLNGTKFANYPGVLCRDGTLFFYGLAETYEDDVPTSFRAAILRPGDTAWTFVECGFQEEVAFERKHCFATYCVDDGNILVCVAVDGNRAHDIWHLLTPSPGGAAHQAVVVVENDDLCTMTSSGEPEWRLESSHVLESHGELLRVSVLVRWHEYESFLLKGTCGEEDRSLVVLVHALEEEDGGRVARWTRRDGRSFTDRVLFLGFPSSFAMEAAKLGSREGQTMGGCVYFLLDSSRWPRRVFRYNFVEGKTKIIDRLHRGWSSPGNASRTWVVPQPAIAPIQVIRERLEAPKVDNPLALMDCTVREERRLPKRSKEPFFSFSVQNLPPGADSSWVRRLFSKHGDVSVAEVTTPGTGSVIMAMATVYRPDDAEAALEGLLMGSYALKVSCTGRQQQSELQESPPIDQARIGSNKPFNNG